MGRKIGPDNALKEGWIRAFCRHCHAKAVQVHQIKKSLSLKHLQIWIVQAGRTMSVRFYFLCQNIYII